MQIVFRVRYHTVPGQSLWLLLKQGDGSLRELPMEWLNLEQWELRLEIESDGLDPIHYHYQLREEGNGLELDEWGEGRVINPGEKPFIWLADTWHSAGSVDEAYETKALKFLLPDRGPFESLPDMPLASHRFSIHVAGVPIGLAMGLIGDTEVLGNWDVRRAIVMREVAANRWMVDVELDAEEAIEYKYATCDPETGELIEFEEGENRRLEAHAIGQEQCSWIQDQEFRRDPRSGFRGAGVAIPVFSLRSETSCGVGEFADLVPFGHWARGLGMKLLQILPIHDTTAARDWTDSYPYSAISCFALHPIYLRLDVFAEAMPDDWCQRLKQKRKALNALDALDYEAVLTLKLELTREVFDAHFETISGDAQLMDFIAGQGSWLLSYAAFCVLRDQHGTGDFSQWGENSVFSRELESVMWQDGSDDHREMLYWIWLQHELDHQLGAAVAHLHEIGVVLKGDLPIGIDRCSVEAWSAPELFHLDAQAGAPPDFFSQAGQNWGFPTYNWERMAQDGYAWWQARLSHLAKYFDAFRIDHILGFFRIWQVPLEQVDGLRGWFEPAVAVALQEFRDKGIAFDFERFCRPWMTREGLQQVFGDKTDEVIAEFLQTKEDGGYEFREAFDTQRKVLDHFGDKENALCKGLLACHGEVLFFESPGSGATAFHPRYGLQRTLSFADLDCMAQEKVDALYNNYFFERQDFLWRAGGLIKLDALRRASPMLLCGEDLGMVPGCVPPAMRETGILSLEIQRMPKAFGAEFDDPRLAPYLSVVSPSTHDMPNLREWWRDHPEQAKRLAWTHFDEPHASEELGPELAAKVMGQQFESPAMWAIVPLQDLLALDAAVCHPDPAAERINDPSINPFNWRYRMHLGIEQLEVAQTLNARIRTLLRENGRAERENA